MRFRDRSDAGRHLADLVGRAELGPDVVVLGLPRGGIPVALEVARALAAPLDVIVVRKLGVPFQPELAMGAIGEDGVRVDNDEVLRSAGLSPPDVEAVERRERQELERRARQYRGGRPRIDVRGRCAVIVDDGIATGSTMRAACQVARAHGASRAVVAVPVASGYAVTALRDACDGVICVRTPEPFYAVGEWYEDFSQTTDEQVVQLLGHAASGKGSSQAPALSDGATDRVEEIVIPAGDARLRGCLTVPPAPQGIVVFAHGSGSSRHSPRNQYVARVLNEGGLATLLMDLLLPGEDREKDRVFDIPWLATRLGSAATWLVEQGECRGPLGLFGASTGAAAALWVAAQPAARIAAVVSRGGRPDLAAPLLPEVRAPTLLIVGERDDVVLELNRRADSALRCVHRLDVVPGATHLFEEPGALEQVARLARGWFTQVFAAAPR
jgi:putative phosphoribosyl transferase